MYKCKYCGREFETVASMAAHVGHCKANPNFKRVYNAKKGRETYIAKHPEKYVLKDFEVVCSKCGKLFTVTTTQEKFDKGKYSKFCSRSCANSRIVSNETKEKISVSLKNSPNLYKPSFKVYTCKYCGKEFKMSDERDNNGRTYCSNECKHKYLSEHTGGYRKGSGRGVQGWYHGIHCDSSWELAFLIYHLEHGSDIKRCFETRKYLFEGEEHLYYPDFVVNGEIIEIKGYDSKQWQSKLKDNTDITVLYKKDMKKYLDYVISKYGIDFTRLYDDSKPKEEKHKFYWMNNSVENVFIIADKYDEYLSKGWVRGRLIQN